MATAMDILGGQRNCKIPTRWSKHHRCLCAERDRLLARDCCAPGTSPIKLDDLSDAAADESQTNLSLVAASATQDTIFEVLAAIRRIERGTYGVCELTGEPIEAERLKAIPWARYSLRGQSELEKTGDVRRRAVPRIESLGAEGNAEEDGEAAEEADAREAD